MVFLLVIQNCVMSEIEHTRTLGKVHQYVNTKILLLAGLLIGPAIADVGDILLRIEYSADSHEPVTLLLLRRRINDVLLCTISKPPT